MKKILMAISLFVFVSTGCQKGNTSIPPVYPEAPNLPCVKIGDVWWAPVNCGYDADHTYGILYQWGRKYGQAYEVGTIAPVSMNKADDTEANKGKFGLYNSTDYNWYNNVAIDNTLWNGSSKGISDPCPAGWRVPTSAELTALKDAGYVWVTGKDITGKNTGSYNGGLFPNSGDNQVFLPAAGGRHYSDGSVNFCNGFGVYWSSSTNADGALRMRFGESEGEGEVTPVVKGNHRAFGNSVRCVLE